jgi:uncharacterized coiled-coil protein SlyX
MKTNNMTPSQLNNPVNHLPLRGGFFLILLVHVCFAFLPRAQAVSPAPDGGYPGGNTAEGESALLSLTSGFYNTAVGFLSLTVLTDGNFNTSLGAGALLLNTADQNTATGAGALLTNTTGADNTANGTFALFSNTTAGNNTATGNEALFSNTTGEANTANGSSALFFNTTGISNTATGARALRSNTTGTENTANGFDALESNTIGSGNTAIGDAALFNNTTGETNTAIGVGALVDDTTGSDNIALGFDAGSNVTTANDVICIGASGSNVSNSCFIGQIFDATSSAGIAVFINSSGRLGTTTSSQRFKKDIEPMAKTSEALFALKPVTFRYKKAIDPQGIAQFGLVAEDVEAVNPDLVVRDKDGKAHSVRYDQVNAMLLNEFLKEHKAFLEEQRKGLEQAASIAALNATLAEQQKGIQVLAAQLKEHAGQIQKVSAQIEESMPAPQTALNDH